MKKPGEAIRAGVDTTKTKVRSAVRTVDRNTRRNGWFRGGVGLGLFVWAQTELVDWLASTQSATQNTEVMKDVVANGAAAEIGALALSGVMNKISTNSNPWLRRAAVVGIGTPVLAATSYLVQRYGFHHDMLPQPFLETTTREWATLGAPALAGTVAGSFLVAPRSETGPSTVPAAPRAVLAHA